MSVFWEWPDYWNADLNIKNQRMLNSAAIRRHEAIVSSEIWYWKRPVRGKKGNWVLEQFGCHWREKCESSKHVSPQTHSGTQFLVTWALESVPRLKLQPYNWWPCSSYLTLLSPVSVTMRERERERERERLVPFQRCCEEIQLNNECKVLTTGCHKRFPNNRNTVTLNYQWKLSGQTAWGYPI